MTWPQHHFPGVLTTKALYYCVCGFGFFFLLAPLGAIAPLSFNSSGFLTYPISGVSLRWYQDFLSSPTWLAALRNSVFVASVTTAIATPLGTVAALGLTQMPPRLRALFFGLFAAPLIAPVIVFAAAVYLVYAPGGLTNSFVGLVLAHVTLATPFVVITVEASLKGIERSLLRAGASLGAPPLRVFASVLLPLIAPGVAAGAVFAFMTSFDETVVAIFLAGPEQRTCTTQMFEGVREQLSPTITAVATVLIAASAIVLGAVELMRRR